MPLAVAFPGAPRPARSLIPAGPSRGSLLRERRDVGAGGPFSLSPPPLLTSPDLSAMLRSPDRQRTLLSLSQVLLAINRHLCSWVLPLHIGGLGFDRFLPSLRRRGAALGAVSDAFVMSRRTSAIRVPCAALGTVCRLLGLSIPSSAFQQIPATALHLPGGASGGVLDLIPSIPILLVPLGGIPELEAQSLRTILQSPVDELLGGRFDFLCMLLLDLLDALSPPVWRGRSRTAAPAPSGHAAAISDGRVVIS